MNHDGAGCAAAAMETYWPLLLDPKADTTVRRAGGTRPGAAARECAERTRHTAEAATTGGGGAADGDGGRRQRTVLRGKRSRRRRRRRRDLLQQRPREPSSRALPKIVRARRPRPRPSPEQGASHRRPMLRSHRWRQHRQQQQQQQQERQGRQPSCVCARRSWSGSRPAFVLAALEIHLLTFRKSLPQTLQATSSICMGANIGHHAARNFKEDWLSKPTHLTALRPVRALHTFSATGQGPGPRAG
jgi:hypothetical protein